MADIVLSERCQRSSPFKLQVTRSDFAQCQFYQLYWHRNQFLFCWINSNSSSFLTDQLQRGFSSFVLQIKNDELINCFAFIYFLPYLLFTMLGQSHQHWAQYPYRGKVVIYSFAIKATQNYIPLLEKNSPAWCWPNSTSRAVCREPVHTGLQGFTVGHLSVGGGQEERYDAF